VTAASLETSNRSQNSIDEGQIIHNHTHGELYADEGTMVYWLCCWKKCTSSQGVMKRHQTREAEGFPVGSYSET